MKRNILWAAMALLLPGFLLGNAGNIRFDENPAETLMKSLNLDYPGLQKVKTMYEAGKYQDASRELLVYYQNRNSIKHPDYNPEDSRKYAGKKLAPEVQEKADKGMHHYFFVHKGYGFLEYGQDIQWDYWPVKDNEIRWQVNRMYWWEPMGLAYWSTGDEKYAKEWIYQYRDWIKKNPLGLSKENDRFAWRPLETSHRLQEQTSLFNIFKSSPHFTAEFLTEFLNNYHTHAERVFHNYSAKGNHLLFEAQRIIYAGCFFPEFKKAQDWRKSGIEIMNKEISNQVYPDGLQVELSPNYHAGTINTFLKALRMARLSGLENEFPNSYKQMIEKMILAQINFSFPDYTYPMFSDAKLENKKTVLKMYKSWHEAFPNNKIIQYFATEGKEGKPPSYLSHALEKGGFYTFRNSWTDPATVMVLKASPPAFWHSQPDNGTFDLWVNGRNFMPDAGAYVYGGDEEIMKQRNWYRQTMVHKTLTLNNADMEICNAEPVTWETSENLDVLSYVNPSYPDLNHRRTVLFVNKKYFIILDNAEGDAEGDVAIHFQLKEGDALYDKKMKSVQTTYQDGNNLLIRNTDKGNASMVQEEGKVSYAYKQELERPAFSFRKKKETNKNISFTTVLLPFSGQQAPKIKLIENKTHSPQKGIVDLTITIDGKKERIKKLF